MKRALSVSVALAMILSMLLSFSPLSAAYAAGEADGAVERRALIIGNAAYAESALTAPEYDAKHMAKLFAQMSFSGTTGGAAEQGALAAITEKTNRTRKQMLADIASAFADADADDVSYFYYSGHGSVIRGESQLVGVDMACLSLTDLKAALDAVPGAKVILLDSCFSGGFISRSSSAPQTDAEQAGSAVSGYHKYVSLEEITSKLKKAKGSPEDLFPFALARKPVQRGQSLDTLFNKGVKGAFSKAPAYMNNSSYTVLTASLVNEYSYEIAFGSLYGPNFIMDGIDYADRGEACSGEFTGMLVAGAGFVTFNSAYYGQTGLLADYDGDKKITATELEHYLKGSVLFSDVSAYPAAADTRPGESPVLFSHDSGVTAPAARARLTDGIADINSPAGSTSVSITLDLSGVPADIQKNVAIYKYPKMTDGMAANGMVGQVAVKQFENVGSGVITWDGKDSSGEDAPDGVYKLVLECGEGVVKDSDPPYLYPGVTVVLNRNCSEFNASNQVALTGSAPYTASGTADITADGGQDCAWFVAPVTGAMNVYADASALPTAKQAVCTLYDADGNAVNYSMTTAKDRMLYMPFYVESGKSYRLKFGVNDDPDREGDVGQFGWSLRLNGTIAVDASVSGAGNGYESWLVIPGATLAGDYVLMSSGGADPAAMLVDSSQTSSLGVSNDFNDRNFLLRTPLLEGHGYLLVTVSDAAFSFTVHSPGNAPAFSTAGIPEIAPDDMGYDEAMASKNGATSYRLIKTGANPEKWCFIASAGMETPLSVDNDPVLLLMDGAYHPIGASDDYGYEYDSMFAAVLEPNSTYILACHSVSAGYDYSFYATRSALTAADALVDKPKAVFMDNGGLSLDRFGNVCAWGENRYGELGLGSMSPSPAPSAVVLPEFSRAMDVWAGQAAGFARLEENSYCYWGMGQLSPMQLASLDGLDIADIRCGSYEEALILTYTGELYLLDIEGDTIKPVTLPGEAAHSAVQIAATEGSCLALAADGKLFAWGENSSGECGVGGTDEVESPTRVTFPDGVLIKSIAAGWDHVLALSAAGEVFAWGNNANDELGQGTSFTKSLSAKPVKVSGGAVAGKTAAAVYAGGAHSMCVDSDGNAYGWGGNAYGEFGLGDAGRAAEPRQITYYGPGKVAVQSMGAGSAAVFAQDFSHHVYGYGANEDYQLARAGQAPDEGIAPLMTLRGEVVAGHPAGLRALHVDTGSVQIADDTIAVMIADSAGSCYIVPEPRDSGASVKINGQAARGILVSVAAPGGVSEPVAIRISHPGGTPADEAYTLTVYRSMSANADLRSLGLSAGAVLSPEFDRYGYEYRITLPETLSSVKVTPVADGYGAVYQIDSLPENTSATFKPAVGQTLYGAVAVTAQSGDTQQYDLTIVRPMMLTGFTGLPTMEGRPSLSPGGTNRMTINYSLSFPATVKLEVQKGGKWVTLMTRKESSAGSKSWPWNGKAGGKYLASGTYKLRMTPTYGGKACAARSMVVRIYSKPSVSVPSLSPSTLKPDGLKTVAFTVSWSKISNVKVEVVNSKGKVVQTVFSASNQAPATRKFSWNGYTGKYKAPAGKYRVKVTCGSVVKYRSFRIK